MEKTFPSIANPDKYGYEYTSDYFSGSAPILEHFRMFETLGDNGIKHSRSYGVTTEQIADYFYSFAAAALKDEELGSRAGYHFNQAPSAEDIAFAASIKYDAAKDSYPGRYFSLELKQISKNEAKRHDKRFENISSNAFDGSARMTYNLLVANVYTSGLKRLQIAEAMREWDSANPKRPGGQWCMGTAAEFIEWTQDWHKAQTIIQGFRTAKLVCESIRLRQSVENNVENYEERVRREDSAAA